MEAGMTAGPRYQVQDCVTVCLDCGVVVIITEAHDRYHSIQSSWAWMRWRRQYERACVREARLREVRRRGTYVQPGGRFCRPQVVAQRGDPHHRRTRGPGNKRPYIESRVLLNRLRAEVVPEDFADHRDFLEKSQHILYGPK